MRRNFYFYLTLLLHVIYGRECFLSCGDFDNCSVQNCQNVCSGRNQEANLGFTSVNCSNDSDLCIYREFNFARNSGGSDPRTAAIPGGCLLDYQHSTQNERNFLFGLGTTLFACEGDHCNVPPIASCDEEAAKARSRGEDINESCLIQNNFVETLQNFSPIRGGFSGNPDNRSQFCVEDNFREFSTDPACFGRIGDGLDDPSECSDFSDLNGFENLNLVTCSFCDQDEVDCNSNRATPDPETILTDQPTKSPSLAPLPTLEINETLTPTSKPTKAEVEIIPSTDSPVTDEEDEAEGEGEEDEVNDSSDLLVLIIGVGCAVFIAVAFISTTVVLLRKNQKMEKEMKKTFVVDDVFVGVTDNQREEQLPGVTITDKIEDIKIQKQTSFDESTSTIKTIDNEQIELML